MTRIISTLRTLDHATGHMLLTAALSSPSTGLVLLLVARAAAWGGLR